MNIPESELPDLEKIRALALSCLPAHHTLLNVRCRFDSDSSLLPDFEVVIEYVDHGDGDDPALTKVHQDWAQGLTQKIRAEWPPSTIRIAIVGREVAGTRQSQAE